MCTHTLRKDKNRGKRSKDGVFMKLKWQKNRSGGRVLRGPRGKTLTKPTNPRLKGATWGFCKDND